jgi:hypothetical protein
MPHNVHPVDHVFPVDLTPSPKRATTEPAKLRVLESSEREVAAIQ